MTGTYCGAPPVLPAQRAPSLLGSRCRLRPLNVPPSTCYGFPAKVCQVASPCRSPDTESLRKRSRCPFSLPTWHGIPAKAFQVAPFCHSPATEFPQKRSRCHFLPFTCHGIPAKVFQVSFPAVHLLRNHHKSVPGDTFLPSTWHDVHADVLAAGSNLKGGAHSFRPEAGRRKQGGEQAVWRQFGGSLNKTPFAAIIPDAGYNAALRHCCAVA